MDVNKEQEDKNLFVTILEVIDDNGRSYSNWNVKGIELSYQNDGRTLKIFSAGTNNQVKT